MSATLRCQDTVGIMPCKLSMLDETVETRLPWLDFSLVRRPCRAISVLHGHNSTVSRQLRYSLSRDCVSPTTPTNLTFHHSVARRKHRPSVCACRPLRLRPVLYQKKEPPRDAPAGVLKPNLYLKEEEKF